MDSSNLKVSIITVCLNSESYIEKTIQSVLAQSYSPIEYILIDGNSSDNTLNIINKYQAEIDIIISENDDGIYDAMNKGVTRSTGDILYFLNSGDILIDDTIIERVERIFIEKPEYPMVYGDLIFYSDKNEKLHFEQSQESCRIFNSWYKSSILVRTENVVRNRGSF